MEPRSKVPTTYPSTPAQRFRFAYTSSVAPKQITASATNSGQTIFNEDEYLDLIRNADLAKNNNQISSTRLPFAYTVTPTTQIEYSATPKSPFNIEYKKFTPSPQIVSTASSPVPHHLQQQSSQQQYISMAFLIL